MILETLAKLADHAHGSTVCRRRGGQQSMPLLGLCLNMTALVAGRDAPAACRCSLVSIIHYLCCR